jgi:serine/threonine-protein kinase
LKYRISVRSIAILIFLITNYRGALSQKIITLPLQGLNGPNGIAVDSQGRLYIANEPGKRVLIFDRDSSLVKIIESDSPDGIAFDSERNDYISNFYSGLVMRYDGQWQADTLAHLLGQPSDIMIDRLGNIYVSEFNLDRISIIDKKGDARIFADGITKPFGLACDNEGNVYVASNTTGQIFKCSRNEKKLLATVPGSVAYITYSDKT